MVFFSPLSAPSLSHWPIHGPQAFENTLAPMLLNILIKPSLSIVYLTCSDPGVIVYFDLAIILLSKACLAIDEALDISS